MNKIDGAKFKEILAGGAKALEMNRETIDALNVFPVPDGDTGTNMSLSLTAAVKEINALSQLHVDEIAQAFARGALKGARGNSGVISSQIFKGFAVASEGESMMDARLFAECLKKGTEIAYGAVTKPKEGTILTVVRVMAEEAERAARSSRISFENFLKRVIDAGEEILLKTPDMLPVLKKAGVVDAGGRGLVTVFDGMYRTLVGEELPVLSGDSGKIIAVEEENIIKPEDLGPLENDYEHITFQYCTEFFIIHVKNEVTLAEVDKYRDYLTTIGDCVLVIGDTDLIKTHVHTNHPDRALKAAIKLGELDGVKIENMLEQNRKIHANDAKEEEDLKPMAMLSICCGDGIGALFKDIGVDVIMEGGQTMNPSVDDILESINDAKARSVLVLPNNPNIIMAAELAKALARVDVRVIPTRNIPEGIAAALAYDIEASPDENEEAMTINSTTVCCAEVTHAVRTARLNRFVVKEGDIIGICDKKIIAKSTSVEECTLSTVRKICASKDVVSIYYGEGVTEDEAQALVAKLEEAFPEVEFACYYGGQPHYYYIISAE